MVSTPCDGHDNTDPNGSNDFLPLVPIMVDRNNTIRWLSSPSESDSQHGAVTGPSFSAENDKEKSSNEASTLQNVMRSNTNLANMLEEITKQPDLSVEATTTTNFNILPMAATQHAWCSRRCPRGFSHLFHLLPHRICLSVKLT